MNKQAFALWENGTYTKPWKALELLNKAIGLGPKHVGAYNNRGDAYRCLEEYTKAIQDFNKAIELDPNDAGVYSNRVISFVLMGFKDKGCSDLRKACEIGYCSGWQWAREKGY